MKIKRAISVVLLFSLLLGLFVTGSGASSSKIVGFSVKSEMGIVGGRYSIDNLHDGDEKTAAAFTPITDASLFILFDNEVEINKIRIAVDNFECYPCWRNIKKIEIRQGDEALYYVDIPSDSSTIQWIETDVALNNVKELEFKVTDVYDNNTSQKGLINEIEFYSSKEVDDEEDSGTAVKLNYGYDFSLRANSPLIGGWEYSIDKAFDSNSSTITGLGSIKDGFLVFEFTHPTDLTQFSINSNINGDWAVPKGVQFYVYNSDVKFRTKLKNPEPITDGRVYSLNNTSDEQKLDLEGDLFKGITHLMIKFTDAYISGTNASWGGWTEMKFFGVKHSKSTPTSEIIATNLKSNTHIMCELGMFENEATDEFMQSIPTRLDAVKGILKLIGKYDEAVNYRGTFNFSDADEENYNLLSYIYAYKAFGVEGDENNNFLPNEPITARAYYKLMLSLIGYESGKDFTWEDEHKLLYKYGIGDMINVKNFTFKDLCNATYEFFDTKLKDSETTLVEKLKADGLIGNEVLLMIADKQDRVNYLDDGSFVPGEGANRNSSFSFTLDNDAKVLEKGSFCYNMPFHYAGTYYGTLPRDNEKSKRDEFANALKQAGARSLRFPGGLPCHQYFIEGEEYTKQFDKDCKNFSIGAWGGLYNYADYNNAWFVDFYDFLDFCKEFEIEPVFQINPSFYVDEASGRVRQAYLGHMLKKTDNGIETMPGYYDHNRIDEAVAQFAKNLDEMLSRGYNIKYWEIGNEDNYINYSSLPVSDPNNPLTRDYMEAAVKYAKEIKKRIPDAYVIATGGFPYETLSDEDYHMLDSTASHYPFARWTIPPDSEKNSASRLAGTNEQDFPRYYSRESYLDQVKNGKLVIDCTETMAWRYEGWDPSGLMHTYANALNVAHNWGELVFDSGFNKVNVMHDLESPWFGYVLYDVILDPGNRCFVWNRNTQFTVNPDDIPEINEFKEKYYFNPASRAFEMLGRHFGGKILYSDKTNVDRLVSGYVSIKDDELLITVVNRLNESKTVNMKFPNLSIDAQIATSDMLQSDYLRASLYDEYSIIKDKKVEVRGNIDDSNQDAIIFDVMPYSVTNITLKANIKGR